MRILNKGCTFDDQTKEWAVWMNKPKDLSLPNRTLYYHGSECKFQNYKNKKGVDMLFIRGKLPANVTNLEGFLIQARADLQKYVEDKKKKQLKPGEKPNMFAGIHPYWAK